jgi:hypothetical protein
VRAVQAPPSCRRTILIHPLHVLSIHTLYSSHYTHHTILITLYSSHYTHHTILIIHYTHHTLY